MAGTSSFHCALFISHSPFHYKRVRHPACSPVTICSVTPSTVGNRTSRPIITKTHQYRDPRGHEWTYESDIIQPLPATSEAPNRSPVIFLHTASGLGVNKTYWNPLLRHIESNENTLQNHQVARFDWVGTATSKPRPAMVETPYTSDYFASQLAHFASSFGEKVVLVSQGSIEPIAIRFASSYPHLVKGIVFATGIGTKYITRAPRELTRKISYRFLTSFAGDRFWEFVATRKYIEGFSRKNLIVKEDMLEEWVTNAVDGIPDASIRFNVFSFISGHFFEDLSQDLASIGAPCLFLAGDQKPDRSLGNKVKSARPPAPLFVRESSFKDVTEERMRHRCGVIERCEGAVVKGAGLEMFFENVELVMPHLEGFLQLHA